MELDTEALYQLFDREASTAPPGSDRLIFTPWLLGERCPVSPDRDHVDRYSTWASSTRGHLVRALAEGIGYNWITAFFFSSTRSVTYC